MGKGTEARSENAVPPQYPGYCTFGQHLTDARRSPHLQIFAAHGFIRNLLESRQPWSLVTCGREQRAKNSCRAALGPCLYLNSLLNFSACRCFPRGRALPSQPLPGGPAGAQLRPPRQPLPGPGGPGGPGGRAAGRAGVRRGGARRLLSLPRRPPPPAKPAAPGSDAQAPLHCPAWTDGCTPGLADEQPGP